MFSKRTTRLFTGLALIATLAFSLAEVQARPGKGGSFGSRGTRSYSAPPVTNTAPRQSHPLPGPGYQNAAPRPGAQPAAPSRARGILGGIGAGLLGAGLIGMLTGHGFFSGIGSLMGILGFVAQIALLVLLARFAMNYFRRKSGQPATAGAPQAYAREAMQAQPGPVYGAASAAAASAAVSAPAPAMPDLALSEADFNNFERLLGEIQLAYGSQDRTTLTQRATPEMANEFNAELNDLARKGLSNRISDVKLLQGDLAEAWREPQAEFATVAMRYSLLDVTVEKATGRVVEGDANRPQEVVENWTFVRAPGADAAHWQLSAIQQA